MKRIKLFLMLLVMTAATTWADTYKDTNGVIYEFTPGSGIASTLRGGGTGFDSDPIPAHEGLTGDIVILESFTVDGQTYTVTKVNWATFMDNIGITTVTIPKTVTTIMPTAFYRCTGLTDIYSYADPSKLEWGGISDCPDGKPNKGTVLHVPSNYLSIYESEFSHLNLTFKGDLPNTDEEESKLEGTTGDLTWKATEIGKITVKDKTTGEEVEKPKYRLTISGSGLMANSYNSDSPAPWAELTTITEVIVEDGAYNIGMYAFYKFDYLTKVSLPSSGLKWIGERAFAESPIAEISLPEGLEQIVDYAFDKNSSLKSINFPASLTSLVPNAFRINNLETITVTAGNTVYYSPEGSNALIRKADNELVLGCPATVIPEGVTSIGNYAFDQNVFLTSIVIPEGVTSIGLCAFRMCENLAGTLTLPNSLITIGRGAFTELPNITEIVIGSGLTSIGESAFVGCQKVENVYCYADPAVLTWLEYDVYSNFMAKKATLFHVKKADLAAWQTKFPNINATFVGDLDGGEAEDEGDANGDGEIDVADIDFVIEHIGEPIDDTNRASDVNGDGEINVADVDYIIERIK